MKKRKKLVSRREVLLAGAAVVVPIACSDPAKPPSEAPDASPPDGPPDASAPSDAGAALDATAIDGADAGDATNDAPDANADAADASDATTPPAGGPGLVVEVSHAGVLVGDAVQADAVHAMVSTGMQALTGRSTDAYAWSALFAPTDIVGIKVNPLAYPLVFSHFETVRAIIRGLNLAGVPNESIVVFDRYRSDLDRAGYASQVPSGVRVTAVVDEYLDPQTDITGYDPDVYVDLPRVWPGLDANDPVNRRSHLNLIVSKQVTKVINVAAMKDHWSAGITMALKNMTYGFVNNVSRTHVAPDNWTKDFLPAIAAIDAIRTKVVLHVADAIVACYDGGPGPPDAAFKPFDYRSLLFATDPVALDRIGREIINAQRAKMGLPAVENTGAMLQNPNGYEPYNERQPQYIEAAAALGLGVADLASIKHLLFAL